MKRSQAACQYRGPRVAGDFFDFVQSPSGRVLVLLLDIAGERATAFHIASALQDRFRSHGAEFFAPADLNEAVALSDLALELNRATLEAAQGVRCTSAFLACYDESIGTLLYINAGHTPAILHDATSATLLSTSGLPFGLFSHATHDAQATVLDAGAALVVVSRGVLEASGDGEEFGIERARMLVAARGKRHAEQVCSDLLDAADSFAERTGWRARLPQLAKDNDRTVLAIIRE
jgi:phosphoserine phosphatase RsbU/P